MTASRALGGRSGVAPTTRARVLEAARELGYVANVSARGLAGGRTNIIGMVVPDLATQYVSEIIAGAGQTASRAGFDLLLYTTSEDQARERERTVLLTKSLSDGLLAVLPKNYQNYLGALSRAGIPVVVIDHRGSSINLPSIAADNYHGARLAMQHLASLGHRRIGFVTGEEDTGAAIERLRGYRDGLAHAGLPFDEALVRPGHFRQPDGFRAASAQLGLPNRPTAIFAANDLSAFGVIEAAREHGLRVPKDLSVIGFDDIPMASQTNPALTTIRQPLKQMGESAVNLLRSLITGLEPASGRVILPTELVPRATTGPAPGSRGTRRSSTSKPAVRNKEAMNEGMKV